ncbi:MAG: hypothetical protein OES93_12770, partial [Gammaproteobacteria bacterium]|nr:hypothetical protein [Gammaproteobacteria bacterium]
PGVRHVSVGLKIAGDTITDELCIHVYVAAKRPDADLPAEERIPKEIDGVRTDVNELQKVDFTVDTNSYRPLQGGCLIGNDIIDLDPSGTRSQVGPGTFGCTATRTGDGAPVLLSNWHVLMKNGARLSDPIFQPPMVRIPNFDANMLPRRPVTDDDAIAHIVNARITSKVDAGIAKLDVSSCCRCCGLDYSDEIIGLSEGGTPPSNQPAGTRAAVPGSTVIKVGAVTGRTVGRVVTNSAGPLEGQQDGVNFTLEDQIEIEGQGASPRFSAKGDSGSVIIDEDGFVVGLLFGETPVSPFRTFANHIEDVCDLMRITINSAESHDTAGSRVAFTPTTLPPLSPTGQQLYAKTRTRLLADPAGAWLWSMAEKYREEIVTLVTTERRVSVVWHRVGGPAVFATALEHLRAGDDDTLPVPPNGVSLADALERLRVALTTHGSDELKSAIAEHGSALVSAARGSETLTDYLERLRRLAPRHETAAPAHPLPSSLASDTL